MSPKEKTPYGVLNVSEDAADEEIKKEYRRLARECHPQGSNPNEARFKEVSRAYAEIETAEKRKAYVKKRVAKAAEAEADKRTAEADKWAEQVRKAREARERSAAKAKAYAERATGPVRKNHPHLT